MGRSALIAVLAVALWGCLSTGSATVIPRIDGGPVCGAPPPPDTQNFPPCAAGTTCVNRICLPTCDAGWCAAGTYCEGPAPEDVCAPVAPIACSRESDCPNPQVCLAGLCSSPQLRADGGYQGCVLNSEPNDACGNDAVCFQLCTDTACVNRVNRCVGLPACGQDGGCPQGTLGSICNDGRNPDGGQLFPGKQRICLLSYCMKDTDCNAAAHCFFGAPALLGRCNFGNAGDP
jgi:hypothetical protein